jgi:hypothetical protein
MGVLRHGVLNRVKPPVDLPPLPHPPDVHLDPVLPVDTPLAPHLDVAATAVASDGLRELPDTVPIGAAHTEIGAATITLPVTLPTLPVTLPERGQQARGRKTASVPAGLSRRLGPSRLNLDDIVNEAVRGALSVRGAWSVRDARASLVTRRLPALQSRQWHPVRGRPGR